MNSELEKVVSMTPAQRAEFFQSHATKIEEGQYFRPYDGADTDQARENYTNLSIELSRHQSDFDLLKAEHNAKIKVLKMDINKTLTELKQNGEWCEGKQYLFDDQVAGTMTILDEQGNFIATRRLLPSERQLSITSKAAANG